MKKTLFILSALFAFTKSLSGQDFPFGSVTNDELDMKKYAKDTSAHAVVLQEFGKTTMGIVTDENIRLIFEYHVKIKILDNKGFDNGTVELLAYNFNEDADTYEKIEEITGTTYYKDEDGTTKKIDLDNSKIYTSKEGKNYFTYKFTMPGMRSGSVIEYKYRIISPYWDNFHPWYFQSDIPKVYSEYEAHIPAYWRYNISLKGGLKLNKNAVSVERKCLMINSGGGPEAQGADCSVFNYAMYDVPALINEDYMTAPKNFLAAINFELADYTNPYTGVHVNETKQWKDVDNTLKGYLFFGGQLKKKGFFKDRIASVIAGKTDDLSKGKAVYAYIQKLFKWNGGYGKYSDDGISTAVDKHTGNDADINMSLVDALNAAGLNASIVLLSTRDHGKISSLFPVISDFNYVIAKLDIGDQSYLLDATDQLLSFGLLPLRCLNDKGRVFSIDKPSNFIDLNTPQKEKTTRTLDFTLQENGSLKGTLVDYATGYDAYKKRVAIKKFNTTDEYVEDVNSRSPSVKVLTSEITNVDSLDKPVIEKYELEINITDKLNGKSLAFNPFFWDRTEINPFRLAERSYPVDLGMQQDERMVLTIHLPGNYTVEGPPKTAGLSLPDNGGKFVTEYLQGENSFSFSHTIQLNKPVYGPEEYPYLKEFFNKIIQSEKADIVLKKKL